MSVKYGGANIQKPKNKHLVATTKPDKSSHSCRTVIPRQLIGTIFPPENEIQELEWYKDQDGNIQIEVKT